MLRENVCEIFTYSLVFNERGLGKSMSCSYWQAPLKSNIAI